MTNETLEELANEGNADAQFELGFKNYLGVELFHGRRLDVDLKKAISWFHTVHQAQTAINVWLRQYNHIRPNHGLNMRPPVPETLIEKTKISGTENWG